MDIKQVLVNNYMPYAKGTIISRAIPALDGLKPSNRRIIHTMQEMGLITGDKSKSARIVGQVMSYHPHGDATIYDTMVRMASGNESLNVPYVESKGNFGKSWSSSLAYAASRYTEAKLTPIVAEMFDGINENAVDMVDNFDNTRKEPTLLPVKFPNILVNTTSGIAVGKSSNIPPFGLTEVCNATIGLMNGSIESVADLMEVIGYPEFPTGGFIHKDPKELMNLGINGRGTFKMTGKVELFSDKILIREIPYKTCIEAIIDDIKANMKGELKEVSSVKDLSDKGGMNVEILIKRGASVRQVLKKINRLTKLRMQVTFNMAVIVDNRCKTLGVYDLLQRWIEFRMQTIKRIYSFRLDKENGRKYLLESWEKIAGHTKDVAMTIASNTDAKAKEMLMATYGLEDAQAEYIMDMKARTISVDQFDKRMAELKKCKDTIADYEDIIESDDHKKRIIADELKNIANKYGKERMTMLADTIPEETQETEEVVKVDDSTVTVVMTEKGYLKRLITLRDETNFEEDESDPVKYRITCPNNQDLLVFTYSGVCYKIHINDIDTSKGYPREYIFSLVERMDDSPILAVMSSGDYSKTFNVVYSSGRGTKVYLNKVSGNRSRYKSVFEAGAPGNLWMTYEDKFFIITRQRRASYIDLELLGKISNRSAFKVARIANDDSIFGVQPASKVPDFEELDLEKYSKPYCIKIKEPLWAEKEPTNA